MERITLGALGTGATGSSPMKAGNSQCVVDNETRYCRFDKSDSPISVRHCRKATSSQGCSYRTAQQFGELSVPPPTAASVLTSTRVVLGIDHSPPVKNHSPPIAVVFGYLREIHD